MSQGGSFLSQDDQKLFVTPGRLVARSVRRVAEGGDQKPELVTRAVLGQLNQLPEFEQNRFRCCCISVVPDDGMSWSAELIAGAIAEAAPQYKRWCIRDAPERSKLPAIAEIIGERRFVNCAAKWKFTTRFLSLRPWMTWAILAFSIVFSAVLEAVKLLKPSIPAGSRAAQSDVWIWLYGLAVALMGFAVQATAKKREIRPKSKSIRELRQRLNEEKESEEFDKFAAELAELLRRDDFPRVIILDDYDALDETSRQVLKAYLNSNPDQNNAELWVIFQSREGERLGSWILDEQAQVVRRSQVALYEQLPLSTREKIELLRVLGRDQAAAQYTPIKLVCGSVTETKKPLIEYFQNWRNSHPAQPEKYGDLDFLYFLSITSAPGDLYLRPSFLSSCWRRKRRESRLKH
ncbi:MAG: hypothetical protein JO210_14680 [Acidobacteriaceae bacterium]|nr:hypothetical protein [Acidobacteriaceae bacterium]